MKKKNKPYHQSNVLNITLDLFKRNIFKSSLKFIKYGLVYPWGNEVDKYALSYFYYDQGEISGIDEFYQTWREYIREINEDEIMIELFLLYYKMFSGYKGLYFKTEMIDSKPKDYTRMYFTKFWIKQIRQIFRSIKRLEKAKKVFIERVSPYYYDSYNTIDYSMCGEKYKNKFYNFINFGIPLDHKTIEELKKNKKCQELYKEIIK